jgi:hypothetical protein
MVFARRAEGQAAGHPFFGSFLCAAQRNEQEVIFFLGVPILWARKEGVRNNLLKTFYVHFFVRHKGPWLPGFSLTQQPKRGALSLKGSKKSRPGVSRSACG